MKTLSIMLCTACALAMAACSEQPVAPPVAAASAGATTAAATPPDPAAEPFAASAAQPAGAVQPATTAKVPATITISTGGGYDINKRGFALFHKTRLRVTYPDAPDVEKSANAYLATEGYDTKMYGPSGWLVTTVAMGAPSSYTPPADTHEQTKATVEKVGQSVVGFFAGILTRSPLLGSMISGARTPTNPNVRHITKDMVARLPPGATKILLTRLTNFIARAQQEVLTVAYGPITDEQLRLINAKALLTMIDIPFDDSAALDQHMPTPAQQAASD